jgi:hypothetical protein
MNKLVYLIAIAVIVIVATGGVYWYFFKTQPEQIACTMEARLCPDGSYVGRTGPKCEFTPCPNITSTSSKNGTGQEEIFPYNSGIQGTVMLGSMCPVQRIPPDPNCDDKPYQTLITIFHTSDLEHASAIINSDAKGVFSISLPPGDYTLEAGGSNFPRCDHPQVTVGSDSYTSIAISCDTGIR